VAHEVSTPLAVIVGRAEQLLGRVQGDERATSVLGIVLGQAERIQQIIRRFLDMARGGPPSLRLVDPADIANAAAASVEHRFAKAGVALFRDLPPDLPRVQCDRELLEQAVVNLLLNACDACAPGGRVTLDIRAVDGDIAFVVDDDGEGLPPGAAGRVTEPFFTTKPAGEGTGLGLAIAREIVQHHRGKLTIEPLPPRGTRARIDVPADEASFSPMERT